MYSEEWATARFQELRRSHTRATEFLLQNLTVNTKNLVFYLMNGSPEWEYWKFLIRMIELAADIRKTPNTTKHLNSYRMFSALSSILQNKSKWVPAWELTARRDFVMLEKHECVRGEATDVLDHEFHERATGQLLLWE